ncbi:site-specific DNA-methyltransferase [Pasteurella multocida]|uniref:site-specific DNA-methyltransferase n=1 Tax=Pasteurella multocida TaxID=747 RepID=UPI0021612345|nr:site-specific DNA-methyltransferase [Pasteurella multocida]MDY0500899.1 site-specific DNA-methyltransferase [Pasteurella multocida]MDY0633442.1 site-specific DNA-methyltransferase [Pasteurella multocida]MDY0691531.1 site-specific DNA-methyltransferase [Pasteurella multocida]WND48633.1 site-specific DNA-methyltransferase [Pasteurella multocida]
MSKELKMHTNNLVAKNIEKLTALFPNCITETQNAEGKIIKGVDFDLLRQELSETIIEGDKERYRLDWVGKKEAILTANAPIAKTLRPCREESVNFDTTQNLFIEGDNLDALKLLQETYLGKVKMIYIDPPYNTGNDFIYNDDFAETVDDFLVRSNQIDEEGNRLVTNTESNGRFHSDWLSMMYSRLKLARNLLTDDGVIFISIDSNEQANLKKICDDVFGTDNFMECFIWNKKNSAKGVPPKNMIVNTHEYILCYGKSSHSKLIGKLRTKETFSNPDNDPRGDWRMSNIKSTLDNHKNRFSIVDPKTNIPYTNFWAFSEDTLNNMIENNRIIFPKNPDGLPKQKEFFNEFKNPYIPIKSDLGLFDSQSTTEKNVEIMMKSKVFLYRKPLDLMKTIIQQALPEKNIILDLFAGSSTTAHAIMQLNAEDSGNRRFIMVQLPEKTEEKSEAYKSGYQTIAEISKERIRRAGNKILADNAGKEGIKQLDIGFRVLKIDSSNMKEVYYTPDNLSQTLLDHMESNIKEDRSAEDLLFQVMLDWGIELSLPIEQKSVGNSILYYVGGNSLVACFDALTLDVINEIAKHQPLRVVSCESAIQHDQDKTNIKERFKQLSPETDVRFL